MKISELMRVLKPSQTMPQMKLAANFAKAIKEARESGELHYEIAGRYTRSGNPIVINFKELTK